MASPEVDTDLSLNALRYLATARLFDSLIHEVRNPLNAISLNIEVLSQKVKAASGGEIPAGQEKNLKAIRDQITRVDDVLRHFAEVLVPKTQPTSQVNFSEVVRRTADVLGHESRKSRVPLKTFVEAEVMVRAEDPSALYFIAMQPLLRAIARSQPGREVVVTLKREAPRVVFKVEDGAGDGPDPMAAGLSVLSDVCRRMSGELISSLGETVVVLPAP